jgi:uncharacterized protein with HEPN domain
MRKDDLVYVGQMLDTARKSVLKVQGRTRADCEGDEDICIVLAHLVQVIGEAARKVSDEFCAQHPEIPWSEIVGMRHKIVHDYMELDTDIVLDVVWVELPLLIEKLRLMVKDV